MFFGEITVYKYIKYYVKAWHSLMKELGKLEKTIYKKLNNDEVMNAILLRYNVINLKALLTDLLTRKEENKNSFSNLTDSYGKLMLLHLEVETLRKQIKRKRYYEKVCEEEYKKIEDMLNRIPDENLDRIFANTYTDRNINICEVYCKKNISEIENVLKNTEK